MKKVIRMLFSMTLVTALLFGVITVPSDIISGATSNPAISDSSSGFVVDANAAAKKKKTAKKKKKSSGYVIDKYIKDGKFTRSDWKKYLKKMGGGATGCLKNDDTGKNTFVYFDFPVGFSIMIGGADSPDDYPYVCVSDYEVGSDAGWIAPYKYGDSSQPIRLFDNGISFPIELMHPLEDTIKYMKKHPDASKKPKVKGLKFITSDDYIEKYCS